MNSRFDKKYNFILFSILWALPLPLLASTDVENESTAPTYSIESKVNELLANEQTKSIIDKYLPKLASSSHLSMIGSMSLKGLAAFPQAGLTDDKLKAIQVELTKISVR